MSWGQRRGRVCGDAGRQQQLVRPRHGHDALQLGQAGRAARLLLPLLQVPQWEALFGVGFRLHAARPVPPCTSASHAAVAAETWTASAPRSRGTGWMYLKQCPVDSALVAQRASSAPWSRYSELCTFCGCIPCVQLCVYCHMPLPHQGRCAAHALAHASGLAQCARQAPTAMVFFSSALSSLRCTWPHQPQQSSSVTVFLHVSACMIVMACSFSTL